VAAATKVGWLSDRATDVADVAFIGAASPSVPACPLSGKRAADPVDIWWRADFRCLRRLWSALPFVDSIIHRLVHESVGRMCLSRRGITGPALSLGCRSGLSLFFWGVAATVPCPGDVCQYLFKFDDAILLGVTARTTTAFPE
jgi:putative transport protein